MRDSFGPFTLPSDSLITKVPELTLWFWAVKILSTGMGESASDFFVKWWGPGIAVPLAGILLVVALWIQFAERRYVAWTYWTAVVMVSVFGTMAADVVHKGAGIPYAISTVFFAIALAGIFVLWYASERTLSIHSITTVRRELFYWAAVMTTFALGTAAGDMTAHTMGIGFLASGFLFAALFALPALAWKFLGLDAVVAFWAAYILTRPLGASFSDWMAVPTHAGGLGWGYGWTTFVLTVIIVALVAYLQVSKADVSPETRVGFAPSATSSSRRVGS